MNKDRRARIEKIKEALEDLRGQIEDLQSEERDAALQVIARPVQPAADVLTACEAVLACPRDWIDFERARLLRIAVRREGVAA